MMRNLFRLSTDTDASAAAEMALVLPILLVLAFGAFDLGNYFLSEHVVDKAVRDAARYAARQPLDDFSCDSGQMLDPAPVQKLARTGDPAGTEPRLVDWTDDSMTTVTVSCDTSGTYSGVFADFPDGVPVVTVSATVPHTLFFWGLWAKAATLNLNASQQAAVMGA